MNLSLTTFESSHMVLDSVFDDLDACFTSINFALDIQDADAPNSPEELDRMIGRLDQVYDLLGQGDLDPDDDIFLLAAMMDDERIASEMRHQAQQEPSTVPAPLTAQNASTSSASSPTQSPSPAASKPTRARPRKEVILEELNAVAGTVVATIVFAVTSQKLHKVRGTGPTWQVVIDVAQALLANMIADNDVVTI